MAGLSGDPRRQANDSIRGYHHQIWHSVHAWLELGDDEMLFLEGAEDLDVLHGANATAIQVKNEQANVTLRTESIRDSIVHYWQLREQNPNKSIHFRYVTTANIGIERGEPFGHEIPGLIHWEKVSRGLETPQQLRDFLLAEKRLPTPLLSFLAKASDAQLVAQLLQPISWDTSQPDTNAVRAAVMRKLVNHGERFGIPPSASEPVAYQLFDEAFEVATRKDSKPLTRYEFQTLFEEITAQRVPYNELTELKRLSGLLGSTMGVPALTQHKNALSGFHTVIHHAPPHELPRLLDREKLLDKLRQHLAPACILSLLGSKGMGKTTIAKRLVRDVGDRCLWVSLTGYEGHDLRQVLNYLGVTLDSTSEPLIIVLDDLDVDACNTHNIEEVLIGILYTAVQRNLRIVTTGHRPLPSRIKRSLRLPQDREYTVPEFSVDEIAELASLHGSESERMGRVWGTIVYTQTSGHPQLVHARVLDLKAKEWPQPSENDITRAPEDVVAERLDVCKSLLTSLSPEQLELLYRLTCLTGPFRRDHAVAIGEIATPVSHSGLIFDSLVGPWIEPISSGYFRVSSLLIGTADRDWSPEKTRQLRVSAMLAILNCRQLTLIEADQSLFLSIATREFKPILPLVLSLLEAPPEQWPAISAKLSWLVYFATDGDQMFVPDDHAVNSILRAFQFRIAVEADPAAGTNIVNAWDNDITHIPDSKVAQMMRFMFTMKVCIYYQVPIGGDKFVGLLQDLESIRSEIPELREILAEVPEDAKPLIQGVDGNDPVALLFAIGASRCGQDGFLPELLAALAVTPEAFRNYILSVFSTDIPLASLMMNAMWLNESEKDSPDSDRMRDVYDDAKRYAREWGCTALLEAAARAEAVILEEYKKAPEEALRILEEVESHLSKRSFIIEDGRATTLFHHGRYSEALELWERTLPEWPVPPAGFGSGIPVFSCHKAGVAAMKLEDWHKAEAMFLEGNKRAQSGELKDFAAGFLADAAYAAWKGDRTTRAVELLDSCLKILEGIPDVGKDLGSFVVTKLVGATIMWCSHVVAGYSTESTQEPLPGWCSNPNRNEQLRELPFAPFDFAWLNLVTLEVFGAGTGNDIYLGNVERLTKSPYPVVRAVFGSVNIRRDFIRNQFVHLPTHIAYEAEEMAKAKHHNELGMDSLEPSKAEDNVVPSRAEVADLREGLIAALVVVVSQHGNSDSLLRQWIAEKSGGEVAILVYEVVLLAKDILAKTSREAEVIMQDTSLSTEERILAALHVCRLEESSPSEMFCAQVLLTVFFSRPTWKNETAKALAEMVSRQWWAMSENRALLRTPRFTVPEIKQACKDECTGFKKVAKILLAASNAVRITLPSSMREQLRQLASEHDDRQNAK